MSTSRGESSPHDSRHPWAEAEPDYRRAWRDAPTNLRFENEYQKSGIRTEAVAACQLPPPGFGVKRAIPIQRIKARLLNYRFGVFGSSVPAQQLRKILGERRARQDHITSRFMRFLLQIALHMGQEADD
jgi:hypothetical protein